MVTYECDTFTAERCLSFPASSVLASIHEHCDRHTWLQHVHSRMLLNSFYERVYTTVGSSSYSGTGTLGVRMGTSTFVGLKRVRLRTTYSCPSTNYNYISSLYVCMIIKQECGLFYAYEYEYYSYIYRTVIQIVVLLVLDSVRVFPAALRRTTDPAHRLSSS